MWCFRQQEATMTAAIAKVVWKEIQIMTQDLLRSHGTDALMRKKKHRKLSKSQGCIAMFSCNHQCGGSIILRCRRLSSGDVVLHINDTNIDYTLDSTTKIIISSHLFVGWMQHLGQIFLIPTNGWVDFVVQPYPNWATGRYRIYSSIQNAFPANEFVIWNMFQ